MDVTLLTFTFSYFALNKYLIPVVAWLQTSKTAKQIFGLPYKSTEAVSLREFNVLAWAVILT